jgi:site-specific DNA recombinase
MSPSHARKGGVKYRYYFFSALFQGQPGCAGSVHRVPAAEIEALVTTSVREHLKPPAPIDARTLLDTHVVRVEVQEGQLIIHLVQPQSAKGQRAQTDDVLHVPWRKTPSRRRREILLPETNPPQDARPIRSETRATLVASIARGRRWLNELIADPAANAESIATRERCSIRKVNMTISLAFLAPDLVKALSRAGCRAEWESLGSASCRPNGLANIRFWASPLRNRCIRASLPTPWRRVTNS